MRLRAIEPPLNNAGEEMIDDPETRKQAETAFEDVALRLPLDGLNIGPFDYFYDGFKEAKKLFEI